ncbi:MAG: class I SAM-dependent methyltransferase [Myxococcota bacterium]|nr:class I SAM-dependent methyltransferase [Myxococcota bacterium]
MATDPPSRPTLSLVPRDARTFFYAGRAGQAAGPLLVLGSATGHLVCELAQAGFTVTGVEPSELLMGQAVAARASRPHEVASRITWVQADLRSVRLGATFPLVLAPQSAFGALGSPEDLDDLLATVGSHLAPEGAFVFDVALPPRGPALHDPEPTSAGRPAPLPSPGRAHFVPHLRERRRGVEKRDLSGLHRLRLRQFTPDELEQALGGAGLQALERYGNFDGKPFDSGDPLMVVVASPV